MTIRRTQHFNLPIVGEVTRTTTLKPGHTQKLRYSVPDEEKKGHFEGIMRIRVTDSDSVEATALSEEGVPYGQEPWWGPFPELNHPYVYFKENVRGLIDKGWGGKAWGRLGERVDIDWEPTLPSQSRK